MSVLKRDRKVLLVAAAALLAVAALILWLPRAAGPKERNFEAAARVLFTLPDPKIQLMYEISDLDALKTALSEAGPEIDFTARVSSCCTARGAEMMGNVNRLLGRAGAGNVTVVQSVELGSEDAQGYCPFTVSAAYGPGQDGGASGEAVSFTGVAGFDSDGLIDYFHMSNYDITAFLQSADA